MNASFLNDFRDPPNTHRGAPFWSWNGEMEPDELRCQIRVLHRMGLGGFFMHSRVGLETEYLGDKWFECIEACLDEAQKLGMKAWLYDEDRWPSGYAGGIVTKDPKNRQKVLVFDERDSARGFKWDKNVVAVFTAKIDGHKASNVRRVKKGARPRLAKGETLVVIEMQTSRCDPWWNGYTYLDTMDHGAVQAFIESTHELYRKKIGEHFGKVVPGIFTDEPNTGVVFKSFPHARAEEGVPWTPKFLAAFRERHGYDLRPHLMELAYDVEGAGLSHARWAYHDTRTHLFVDAFSRQIGEWCEKHNLEHTGHVLLEETMADQTGVVGGAMRFYEHMQAPGMDLLTEYRREIDNAKQVASVARQMGRTWRLTETYGCTGWDFPFSGHKAVGDWQAAMGINLRCHHLSWYTMAGEAKRDYPASIFFQSPWWEWYDTVEDHFSRVHVAMTRGEEVRDLLVVHPLETMWTKTRRDWRWDEEVVKYNDTLPKLRDSLLKENIDFDYGDEDMLSRLAKVSKTKQGPVLRVGKAAYRGVVVPQMETIRSSTVALLKRFAKAGGRVVFAGNPPAHVDVAPSAAATELAAMCPNVPPAGRQVAAAVEEACRRVSIEDGKGRQIANALYLLREDKEAFYLFISNLDAAIAADKKKPFANVPPARRGGGVDDVTVTLLAETKGAPLELDTATGEVFAARGEKTERGWSVATSLEPIGSRLFVFPKKKAKGRAPKPRTNYKVTSRRAIAPKKWDYSLTDTNVLVLDKPRYRIGGGKWRKPLDILAVDRAVRDELGVLHRGGGMNQPWSIERKENPKSTDVELEYTFDVDAFPTGEIQVAMERPHEFAVSFNGTPVDLESACGWWVDPSIVRVPLDVALLRSGENTLRLRMKYDEYNAGLEIVYILGQFGARAEKGGRAVMTRLPESLKSGDWTKQGLPFYSGNVVYRAKVKTPKPGKKRLFVAVPDFRGAAARVLVDGKPAGVVAWEPQEIDVTDYCSGPTAEVAVEVASHRRNSFGPLHFPDPWPYGTGPGNYVTHDSPQWTDDFVLVPCGLMKNPELVTKEAIK